MSLPVVRIGKRIFTILFPDILRPLSRKEREALQDSIEKNGVLVPVIIDEDNGVIDGGNRLQIANLLGLGHVPLDVRQGLTIEQKADLALILNASRRHLNPAEWKEAQENRQERIARVVELRRQGESLRTIGEKEGVSLGQVQRDLATVSPDTVEPEGGKVQGRDGKARPATMARPTTLPPEPEPEPEVDPPSLIGLWRAGAITAQEAAAAAHLPYPEQERLVAAGPAAVKARVAELEAKAPPMPPSDPVAEKKAQLGERWHKAMHDLWMTLNSVRDCGGLAELASRWNPEGQAATAAELRQINSTIVGWIEVLEELARKRKYAEDAKRKRGGND